MLWEWRHRAHVEPWWERWSPHTYKASVKEWQDMVDGAVPQRAYLIRLDGREVGYIEGYRLSEEPEFAAKLGLDHDAVGADVYIAEPGLLEKGIGSRALAMFYLRLMSEKALDFAMIDPEVTNARAIRAYEKA